MASRTQDTMIAISDDSEPETAIEDSGNVATSGNNTAPAAPQELSASTAGPAGVIDLDNDSAQQDEYPSPAPEAKSDPKSNPKPKPRGKGSRMLKEIGDYMQDAESDSDRDTPEQMDEIPEELLEGVHRTRATLKNVDNAVKNRSTAARKSLNDRALMREALSVQPMSPKGKKRVKHLRGEDDVAATVGEVGKVEQKKPSTRKMRENSRVVDSDEAIGEALSQMSVEVKVAKGHTNQKKKEKAPPPDISDNNYYEDENDDAEDTFVPKATSAYLRPPGIRQTRQSSRLANPTKVIVPKAVMVPKKPSPPKLKTSGMTWSGKKNLVAWLLQQVDYAPYHPQISQHDLEDRRLTSWFNDNHEGFNWDISDTTVAHLLPGAVVFQDFVNFLHTTEHYAGQHNGAIKVTMPHEFIIPPQSSARSDLTQAATIRAHSVSIALREKSKSSPGDIFAIDPNGPHNVNARSILTAIQADRHSVLEGSSLTGVETGTDVWKQHQVVDVEREDIVLLSAWRPFAENVKATTSLRRELGCGNPCFSDFPDNSLRNSSSTKIGVNSAAFDLCSTACGMQKTEVGAYRLIYHHHGAPRVWTVVRPADFQKLERLFEGILQLSNAHNSVDDHLSSFEIRCHQFVRHNKLIRSAEGRSTDTTEDPGSSLYLSAEVLAAKGVEFTKFVQYQGELVILFPFSYYQSYNVGPNIVETMAYASSRWEVFPMAGLLRQCTRSCFRGKQPNLVDLDFARPILPTVRRSEASVKKAVEHTRKRFRY